MSKEMKGVVAFAKLDNPSEAKAKINKAVNQVETKAKAKENRVRQYRAEASKMASMANKRIARLEAKGLTDTPAYQGYIASGGGKFSVRGKDHNQLQSEVARMKAFVEANTSTITGVNDYLKDMAKNTGIKYKNMEELHAKAGRFFELSNKVEEYLRTVEDMASAIGYQKIWEAVNTYTQSARIDLADTNVDIDDLIKDISDALTEHQKPENVMLQDASFITDDGLSSSAWFKLPKDKE